MTEILNQINTSTSNNAIIVGGVAKWLNGYLESYNKTWIDITIPSEFTSSLDTLGTRLEMSEGTTFPFPTEHQYIIKTDSYILDVFVQNTSNIEFSEISGSKVITPQADLDWHLNLSGSIPNEYTHQKVVDRKILYQL